MYLYRNVLILSLLMMSVSLGENNNALNHTIYNRELNQFHTDFNFSNDANRSFGDIIETYGMPIDIRSIEYDGNYFWGMSSSGTIYKFDLSSGQIFNSFEANVGTPIDIEVYQEYILATGYANIVKTFDFDGNLIHSIPSPLSTTDAVAFDGTTIYVAGFGNNSIYLLDPEDGAVIDEWEEVIDWEGYPYICPRSLKYYNGQLWYKSSNAADGSNFVALLDIENGEVIAVTQNDEYGFSCGITIAEDMIYIASEESELIFKIDDAGYLNGDLVGCTDSDACNYDPDAEEDDGSCEYPEGTCDCDDVPIDDYCDCDGNMIDECGECGSDGYPCDEIIINFDEVDAPCNFVDTSPINDEYFELGVMFEGVDGNSGHILNECGNFGLSGYSPPNFLAFANSLTGLIQKISFINNEPNYVELGVACRYPGTFTMSAYSTDTLLAIDVATNASNNAFYETLSIESSDEIAYVMIEFNPVSTGVFVIDDLMFSYSNTASGDLNGDGEVNIYDIIILISLVFDGEYNESGDVNGDGILNIADCVLLVDLILDN